MKLEINYQTGKTTNYVEVKQPVGQERNQGENFKNTLRLMKMEYNISNSTGYSKISSNGN